MNAERVNGEIYNLVEHLLMNQTARPDNEEEMKREPSLPATSREQPVQRQTRTAQSKVQLGPRYEGQLNPMAEPIPHEVRPLVRTHVYHPYHAADRQAETDS